MDFIKKLFKKNNLIPLLIFHLVFFVLVFKNFPIDKFFIGWDSLSPELNFGLNFKRSLFAAWQENYGLGVVSGHGFATQLPHTLVTYLLSLALPIWAIRSAFTFLCLYLGGLGMYFLMKAIIRKLRILRESENQSRLNRDQSIRKSENQNSDDLINRSTETPFYLSFPSVLKYIPLFSALFYILNLGTVQIFYIQLETFIAHFAALPWLFWIILKLWEKKTKKNVFLFIAINFFASLQGFIPSLFISYMVALVIFLAIYIISEHSENSESQSFRESELQSGKAVSDNSDTLKHRYSGTPSILSFLNRIFKSRPAKNSILVLFLTLITNAYWLFPFLYYQLTRNKIFLNSYNNSTSTPYFIDINKKYGTLDNVVILKGYLFDSFQLGDYILRPWMQHYSNIFTLFLSYSFFIVILAGLLYFFIFQRNWIIRAFSIIFLFFFLALSTDLFLVSNITSLIQQVSPTFQQAFRTAFTKFSIGLSFSYSIFFGFGIIVVLGLLQKIFANSKKTSHPEFISGFRNPPRGLAISWRHKFGMTSEKLFLIIIFASILFYALPAFKGDFLYNKLTLKVPQSYFDVISFFKDKENARIADFPQDCPEGWYSYKWGYFGSGFYWYGIKQPFMSRSFDVWGAENENYFWEINKALHAKDYDAMDTILQKYNIKWVLYDPNMDYCRDQKSIWANQDLLEHLDNSPRYKLAETFKNDNILPIKIYENNDYLENKFITTNALLKNIGPKYSWNDNDTAYKEEGDYVTKTSTPLDIYYPFRELFTRNSLQGFVIKKTADSIVLSTNIPKNLSNSAIRIKSFTTLEKSTPMILQFKNSTKTGFYDVYLSLLFPKIYLDENLISNPTYEQRIGEIKANKVSEISVVINGEKAYFDSSKNIFTTTFSFEIDNVISIISAQDSINAISSKSNTDAFLNQDYSTVLPEFKSGKLSIVIPKVTDKMGEGIEFTKGFSDLTPSQCDKTGSPENDYEVLKSDTQEYMRLISKNSAQCINIYLPKTVTYFSYLLEIKSRHISGNHAKFSIFNKDRLAYNTTYLPSNSAIASNYYIIPPTFPNEISYTVVFENGSKSDEKAINDFAGINLYHIPYDFLKEIKIVSINQPQTSNNLETPLKNVDHPNESLYIIKNLDSSPKTLILSQSYDAGWKAYKVESGKWKVENWIKTNFPFIFGKEIKNHVLVNNWANGWEINNFQLSTFNSQLIIIFWPQYLEFLGFGVLVLLLVYTAIKIK